MSGCRDRGGDGSIDGSENRKRPPSVAAVRTSPPSWPCISRRRETTPERSTISGRRRRTRYGGRPAGRRPNFLPGRSSNSSRWPETPERAQQELSLQVSLGATLSMTQGYTAPEVKRAYDRAHALCGQVGESPHLFPALFGLCRFEFLSGELQTARALGEELVRLAQREPGPGLRPSAHAALGATLFYLGEPAAAHAQLEQGLRVYDRHQQGALILQHGEDTGVMCLNFDAWALQLLGYSDQALTRSRGSAGFGRGAVSPLYLGYSGSRLAPFSISSAGRPRPRKRGPSRPLPCSPSMGFHRTGGQWQPCRWGGRLRSRERPKSGLRICAKPRRSFGP